MRGIEYAGSFGTAGTGAGEFSQPVGVAVGSLPEASEERVYVVDSGNDRVEWFNAQTHAFGGSFDGAAAPTGKFSEPTEVAVDDSCVLEKLSAAECAGKDPSAGDVYVIDSGHSVIDKFTPDGEYLGQITAGTFGLSLTEPKSKAEPPVMRSLNGVAVGVDGSVWVSEEHAEAEKARVPWIDRLSDGLVNTLMGSGFCSCGLAFQQPGLGVDTEDEVFVPMTGFAAEPVIGKYAGVGNEVEREPLVEFARAAQLGGLGGPGVEECARGSVFVADERALDRFTTEGESVESLRLAEGLGKGVATDCATHDVYVSSSANDIEVFVPEAPGLPAVEGGEIQTVGVSNVSSSGAEFSGEVNPRSEPGEEETHYKFEYEQCASISSCANEGFANPQSVEGVVEATYEVSGVTGRVTGLQPGAVYHVRLSARNSNGETIGRTERVFVTQGQASAGLLDGRVWEQVSPESKLGGLLPIEETGLLQAAASGDAITYTATSPVGEHVEGNANDTQVLSVRTQSGWLAKDLTLPHESSPGPSVGAGGDYRMFSSDLAIGLVQPFGAFDHAISPLASEGTPFSRLLFANGNVEQLCEEECFTPIVSEQDTTGGVPFGVPFGESGQCSPSTTFCGPVILGASEDAKSVVITSQAPLLEHAGAKQLYVWRDGGLAQVSVLPNQKPAPAESGLALGYRNEVVRGAISKDGSQVVWSETTGGNHLYVRNVVREQTVQLDVPESEVSGGSVGPVFQFASADGSRIFFTDTQRLTANSGAEHGKPDLYECLMAETEAGALRCTLRDLTPAGGESAAVQGTVIGASEDGSSVYFVANGVLSTNTDSGGETAIPGDCEGTRPSTSCNLYVYREGEAAPQLVAVVSGADYPDWAGGSPGELAKLTARVSPDGAWLAFMSARPLTGYDNRDSTSGERDEEVFVFHDPLNGESGSEGVACASCNPSGARPEGEEYSKLTTTGAKGLSGGDRVWEGSAWLSGFVPGWTPYRLFRAAYQSRYLSDSGRLFFNSRDALVPGDGNHAVDVYEWEPADVGLCRSTSESFSQLSGGCIGLVSSGLSNEESAFVDASESGSDVFFLTAGRLVAGDTDTALDMYDARVQGGFGQPSGGTASGPVACSGPGCKSLSPQGTEEGFPLASMGYAGVGNLISPMVSPKPVPTRAQKLANALKVCRKYRVARKRRACEAKARKTYGPKKASKKPRQGAKKKILAGAVRRNVRGGDGR